jgi:iron complex transport system substrate-binding protein
MSEPPTIVSLIASATEIVCALGLQDRLVGVSHECDYPPEIRGLPVLSKAKVDPTASGIDIDRQVRELAQSGLGLYEIDVAALGRLAPGLVVTQDQCEVCAVSVKEVEHALCAADLPDTAVCTLLPHCLEDVFGDIHRVAQAAGVKERGEALVADCRERLAQVESLGKRAHGRPKVAFVEWMEPLILAGGWMPELIRLAGGQPVMQSDSDEMIQTTWQELASHEPDLVVISPCGYPIEKSLADLQAQSLRHQVESLWAVKNGCTFIADGNAYFSRPGPRLIRSVELLFMMMHPETNFLDKEETSQEVIPFSGWQS